MVDEMNQEVIAETRWCVSKWAICDFYSASA